MTALVSRRCIGKITESAAVRACADWSRPLHTSGLRCGGRCHQWWLASAIGGERQAAGRQVQVAMGRTLLYTLSREPPFACPFASPLLVRSTRSHTG